MTVRYHSGEFEVRRRAGVQESARRVGGTIRSSIPPAAQDFLLSQRMAVVGTVDAEGRVRASLLTGPAGFMRAVDEQTVWIDALPVPGDSLTENLRARLEIGMLVIDLATRRRMRLNGKGRILGDGRICVEASEVYSNCPKYIQSRVISAGKDRVGQMYTSHHATSLSPIQQDWIAKADTFFIASAHPEVGADVSHRGGYPGFVRIVNSETLVWPDYSGNTMFQTLGNILVNPNISLLFIEFERGDTLQLTGQARVLWDAHAAAKFPGSERVVEFCLDQAIESAGASLLQWRFEEYSPFNPT
ncbi:MAG: pyridoxamine 5'-phosphate oxidase family protein [Nitrospiraceae bacterium]